MSMRERTSMELPRALSGSKELRTWLGVASTWTTAGADCADAEKLCARKPIRRIARRARAKSMSLTAGAGPETSIGPRRAFGRARKLEGMCWLSLVVARMVPAEIIALACACSLRRPHWHFHPMNFRLLLIGTHGNPATGDQAGY